MDKDLLIQTVIRAREGDSYALQELYMEMYKNVYYLALRFVKNPEDAEDITQEVYITMQQSIAQLREPVAFFGWVNQITANKCKRFLDKYKGISKLDDEEELLNLADDDPMNLPDMALDNVASRQIILDVIDALPDGQRACITLYYYSQNTVAQIADALEVNENTVKSRLALARAKIRAALEDKAENEGIKLWGIPLALTPILQEAAREFVMSQGAEARILEFISKATVEAMKMGGTTATSASSGATSSTAGSTAAGGAVKAGFAITTKQIAGIVAGVILAGAVTAAGIIFLPQLFEPDDRVSQEEYDRAVEELERLQEELEDTEPDEAPEDTLISEVPSSTAEPETPSPTQPDDEPDAEWKQIYRAFILETMDFVNNANFDNYDWNGYYPTVLHGFGLIDLNFDGTPELLVYGPGDLAAGLRIFTITSDGLEMIANLYDLPRFSLFNRTTDDKLTIIMDTSSGDGGETWGTIHMIDDTTNMDIGFFNATLVAQTSTEAGIVNTYTFNGIDVNEEEYTRLRTDIYNGYEEVEGNLFRWEDRWHPDNSTISLDEFLDTFGQ